MSRGEGAGATGEGTLPPKATRPGNAKTLTVTHNRPQEFHGETSTGRYVLRKSDCFEKFIIALKITNV